VFFGVAGTIFHRNGEVFPVRGLFAVTGGGDFLAKAVFKILGAK
jgi:hypothetical protein